jgi:hypothetical protein
MLDGKKTIIQTIVGGCTQFLTKAQGMPKSICNEIIKEIHTFLWEGSRAPIAKETLYDDVKTGGINLLNLHARNEAINIIWLKDLLDTSPMKPTWAHVADILLRESAPPNISVKSRSSPFLQTWNAPIKGKRAQMLDNDTIQLIKTAKNAQLQFAPRRLSLHLKEQLPAWYHIGEPKTLPQNQSSRCLIKNHNTREIKDLLKITKRLDNQRYRDMHSALSSCHCDECKVN